MAAQIIRYTAMQCQQRVFPTCRVRNLTVALTWGGMVQTNLEAHHALDLLPALCRLGGAGGAEGANLRVEGLPRLLLHGQGGL